MPFGYYEEKLSPRERAVYRALLRGLSSYETSFPVPRLDTKRLGEIFSLVRLDRPLVFCAEKLSFTYCDSSSNVTVKPEYSMKKQEYFDTLEIVKKRVKKILAPSDELGEAERELFIHDWIVKNVRYDRLTKQYSHEVTGPLCHGIGVCEGMAKTFKLLCDESGIDSLVVTGIGVPPDEATGKKSERHAWNVVFAGGRPYAVDVTFDNTLTKDDVRYDYYNVSDRIMSRDHGGADHPVPACPFDDGDRYVRCSGAEDVAKGLRAAARPPYRASFRIDPLPEGGDVKEYIIGAMRSERRFARFGSFSYSANFSSGVIAVSLKLREEV